MHLFGDCKRGESFSNRDGFPCLAGKGLPDREDLPWQGRVSLKNFTGREEFPRQGRVGQAGKTLPDREHFFLTGGEAISCRVSLELKTSPGREAFVL